MRAKVIEGFEAYILYASIIQLLIRNLAAGCSIETNIAAIQCSLLVLDRLHDEYGTLQQIHNIKAKCP